MPLDDGAVFAGFRIVRLLGSGGMGEVYLAQHPRLPRREALKILSAAVSADPVFRERFTREADIAAALSHPHVVGVHDRGEFKGQLWISMEYIDGTDAARLMHDRYPAGMPADEAVEIITAVAGALDYAHQQGLLHRDIKPANILLTRPDDEGKRRVFLADFGIACELADPGGLTATDITVGTVAYAAPEQLTGQELDGRADQYALAATAFHLLTGAPPYQHSNPVAVIGQHLNAAIPKLSDCRPDLADFDQAMSTALAKDPDQRFSSCRDFAKALRDIPADQWEEGFHQLLRYVERHGHTRVPRTYTFHGFKLGHWVNNQRNFHADGRLEAHRERRLQEVPCWAWDTRAAQWEEAFSQLLHYVDLNGDARVLRSYTTEDGYKLGEWVITQRNRQAKGTLDAHRERRLEDLPGWTWDPYADRWEEGFSRVLGYVDLNGDARVPRWMCTDDGYRLGSWVLKQRQRHAEGTLDADREHRLEELPGWAWDAHADRWEHGFSRLVRYVESRGDARVPAPYTVDGYKLGRWVVTQRHRHAKGTLDADRQHRLQQLPGWTWKASSST
jgi:hypothetical protein